MQQKTGYADGERLVLPGGGQELGESLDQALIRECREEIGAQVVIGDLLHVAEFHKPRETIPPTIRHQVEFLFACAVSDDYVAMNGPRPDKHQVDVVWIPREGLQDNPVYPRALVPYLSMLDDERFGTYLRRLT